MATLEELRKWFGGEKVKGLPSINSKLKDSTSNNKLKNPPIIIEEEIEEEINEDSVKRPKGTHSKLVKKLKKKTALKTPRGGRYVISKDGDDAMLEFGKHKGMMLSDILKTNKSYLDWINKEEFPEELKDVCKYLLRRK
jgi:hypothetical protein